MLTSSAISIPDESSGRLMAGRDVHRPPDIKDHVRPLELLEHVGRSQAIPAQSITRRLTALCDTGVSRLKMRLLLYERLAASEFSASLRVQLQPFPADAVHLLFPL